MDKNHMDLCHGPLFRQIVIFSLPIFLSGVLQLAFNAADLIVIGRFASKEALAAVGVTGPMIGLLVNLFGGLSVGAGVVVAQYFGAKDRRNVSRAVHTAVFISLIGGLALSVISALVSPSILEMMNLTGSVLELSCRYMMIYCCGIPFSVLFNFCYGILRAVGDTRRPMYYLIGAGVLNLVLNLIFVIKFRMSVAGVAWATVISQVLATYLIIRNLRHAHDACRLNFRLLRIHHNHLVNIVKIGIPAGLQSAFYSVANMALLSEVAKFGGAALAGNSAAVSVEGFLWQSVFSFAQAALSFSGQNYGGGFPDRARRAIRYSLLTEGVLVLVLGLSCYAFAREIVWLYNPDPEVGEFGRLHMKYCFTLYFICAIQEIVAGALRGLGKSFQPAVASFFGIFVFRMIWVFGIFPFFLRQSIDMLYLCYPFSWLIPLVPNAILLKKMLKQPFALRHKAEG